MIKFQQVYDAAKALDSKALQNLRRHINEYPAKKTITAAEQLAAEGNFEAVSLLMRFGALIDPIARGFARGGYTEHVEFMRRKWGADICYIAEGVGENGETEYCSHLIAQYQQSKPPKVITAIAKGAARGGHIEFAEKLRQEYQLEADDIAEGALSGGQHKYFDELLREISKTKSLWSWQIKHSLWVYSEYETYVSLFNEVPDSKARHFAFGGEFEQALQLMRDYKDDEWLGDPNYHTYLPNIAVEAAGTAGHFDFIDQCLGLDEEIDEEIDEDADEYLDEDTDENEFQISRHSSIWCAIYGGHFAYLQNAFTAQGFRPNRYLASDIFHYFNTPKRLTYFLLSLDKEWIKPFFEPIVAVLKYSPMDFKDILADPKAYLKKIIAMHGKVDFTFPSSAELIDEVARRDGSARIIQNAYRTYRTRKPTRTVDTDEKRTPQHESAQSTHLKY